MQNPFFSEDVPNWLSWINVIDLGHKGQECVPDDLYLQKIYLVIQFQRYLEEYHKHVQNSLHYTTKTRECMNMLSRDVLSNPRHNVFVSESCLEDINPRVSSRRSYNVPSASNPDNDNSLNNTGPMRVYNYRPVTERPDFFHILKNIQEVPIESKRKGNSNTDLEVDEEKEKIDDNQSQIGRKRSFSETKTTEVNKTPNRSHCQGYHHTDKCLDMKVSEVKNRLVEDYVSQDTLQSYRSLVDLFKDEQTRRQQEDNAIFAQYQIMIKKRQENMQKIFFSFKEAMMQGYIDILTKRIVNDNVRAIYDKQNHKDKKCALCQSDGPDYGLLRRDCKCGPIGHLSCILSYCFKTRLACGGKTTKIKCFLCRNPFTESDIVKIHFTS